MCSRLVRAWWWRPLPPSCWDSRGLRRRPHKRPRAPSRGTVKDVQGGVIPGATVTLISESGAPRSRRWPTPPATSSSRTSQATPTPSEWRWTGSRHLGAQRRRGHARRPCRGRHRDARAWVRWPKPWFGAAGESPQIRETASAAVPGRNCTPAGAGRPASPGPRALDGARTNYLLDGISKVTPAATSRAAAQP